MSKIKASFLMNQNVHFEAKILAVQMGTTLTALFNRWIEEGLEKELNKTREDE